MREAYGSIAKWYTAGTPRRDRFYIVGRLVPQPSGPAAALVAKWGDGF